MGATEEQVFTREGWGRAFRGRGLGFQLKTLQPLKFEAMFVCKASESWLSGLRLVVQPLKRIEQILFQRPLAAERTHPLYS